MWLSVVQHVEHASLYLWAGAICVEVFGPIPLDDLQRDLY